MFKIIIATFFMLSTVISHADDRIAAWSDDMLKAHEKTFGTQLTSFESEIIKAKQPAVPISVDISGMNTLCLMTKGYPDRHGGHCVWANPTLTANDGSTILLTSLKPVSAKTQWGKLYVNESHQNKPLEIGGQVYTNGFWIHCDSSITFKVDKKYKLFTAEIGLHVTGGRDVRFTVTDETLDSAYNSMVSAYPEFEDIMNSLGPTWFVQKDTSTIDLQTARSYVDRLGQAGQQFKDRLAQQTLSTKGLLTITAEALLVDKRYMNAGARLSGINPKALDLAFKDLSASHPSLFPDAAAIRSALDEMTQNIESARKSVGAREAGSLEKVEAYIKLQRDILLRNPLIDFEEILLIKRRTNQLGLPANWNSNSSIPAYGYDNEIDVMSIKDPDQPLKTVYRPKESEFVGDVCLHFDADRILFSQPGTNKHWQIFEMKLSDSLPAELPLISEPGVHNYDSCYLPDDNILFTSTAPMIGVPCVRGSSHVSNTYRFDRASGKIRRLTFDQEHNWCPTVMDNGRIMYLRWEYSDIPHYVARILFHMNPDGTGQLGFYGSNSYWPNSMFYAKPVPGHPTMFCAIVVGHHDVQRTGELILFDAAKGRFEADGVVQRIPGRGQKVEPIISDSLIGNKFPKFLHPQPLSDKYFIAASQPEANALWGIYLVDVFDNMLCLKEIPDYVLFEPVPLKKRVRPPVIPSRVKEGEKTATMYISDIYYGPGLKDVPKGTVKQLRLITYHFSYQGMGGQVDRVGLDGPWDIKRVLGTVPVEEDGSAFFTVPANTPISIQPLDAQGKAIALMRSWTTAMPGEFQSCIGCHESQNDAPSTARTTTALTRPPSQIAPWYGLARGFSFKREVQPVLDRYCVGCHDGKDDKKPDFTTRPEVYADCTAKSYREACTFPPSYIALWSYVRTPTIESDMHLLPPYEYNASTTELIQVLEKGHHNVKLDKEAWDRLYTWIDLHSPAHGTWQELAGAKRVDTQREKRMKLMKLYADKDYDEEAIFPLDPTPIVPIIPKETPRPDPPKITASAWPFDSAEAKRRQSEAGETPAAVDLGDGIKLELVRIPAGEAVLGNGGRADFTPPRKVAIGKPYLMGKLEVTNEQFAQFDSKHDSRIEQGDFLQFSVKERGYPVNEPKQPVCRVSWNEAQAFCEWLSQKTGRKFSLPTGDQWEYACRAGTETPFWFGSGETNFLGKANLADKRLRDMHTFGWGLPSGCVPEWRPAITSVDDGHRVSAPVGTYEPNPWGLYDMHGNVWEWTLDEDSKKLRCVRGGSWYDRPYRATSSFSLAYNPWQVVYNVGFRVICEE